LRSELVRRSRRRRVALGVGALGGALLGALLLWRGGVWVLNRLVYENAAFAIQSVEVRGNERFAAEQVRRWARVRVGENLLALDLGRVERDLRSVPWLGAVAVERILPGTLRLRVSEREAVAQVLVPRAKPGGGVEAAVFLVDAQGFVLLPMDPQQRVAPLVPTAEGLPVLAGIPPRDLLPGRRLASPPTDGALGLISRFAFSQMAGLVDLRRVDVSVPGVLVVTTGQGSEVTLGLADLDGQLRRWRKIHELGLQLKRSAASIDLAVSNNVPVRWLEANVIPVPAKPPKTNRTRKRNV